MAGIEAGYAGLFGGGGLWGGEQPSDDVLQWFNLGFMMYYSGLNWSMS